MPRLPRVRALLATAIATGTAAGLCWLAAACATPARPTPHAPGTTPAVALPSVDRPLDWSHGTWEGVRRDGADGSAAPMRLWVEPILGGAGRSVELQVSHGDGVYRGFAVDVRDFESGTWRRRYVNDARGRFAVIEGEVEADGGRSVWRGAAADRRRESRQTSERLGPDRWRRTMEVSDDGDDTWRVLWRDDLRRVAAR